MRRSLGLPSQTRRRLLWAGVAVTTAISVMLAWSNVGDFVFLEDHRPPAALCWPLVCLTISTAAILLVSPGRRRQSAVTVAASTAAVFFAGVAVLVDGRGEDVVDRIISADGRYEARVLRWTSMIGEEGWDVAIYRRDSLRLVGAGGGCLFSEVAAYRRIQSVEAGHVRIATDYTVVDIRFDPEDMRIISPIPADLCAGYE